MTTKNWFCQKTMEIIEKKGKKLGRFTLHGYRKGIELEYTTSLFHFEKRFSGIYRVTSCWFGVVLEFTHFDESPVVNIYNFNIETRETFRKAYMKVMRELK